MRIDKFLASQGYGSRKEVKKIIKNGQIRINDLVIKNDGFQIDEYKDVVMINNTIITYQKYLYIMLYKPKGYVSATNDTNEATVLDLVKDYQQFSLFPIGRLDKDTEGLLILSNDGELAHKLLSPAKKVVKTYYVETKKSIRKEDIQKIEEGITIDTGYLCLGANVELIDERRCYISITEGKFHQIKKMIKATNNKVEYLKRVRFANISLDKTLEKGEFRKLTNQEVFTLQESVE